MGRRYCVVPKCCNSKSSINVALFGVPKNKQKFLKWSSVLACAEVILGEHNYLCESHFQPYHIHNSVTKTDPSGKVIFARKLARKTLTEDPVPCFINTTDNPVEILIVHDDDDPENPDQSFHGHKTNEEDLLRE